MTENPSAASQPLPELMESTRQRALDKMPHHVWDCERCNTDDSMRIRRSTLNSFKADDILLKCVECKYAPVHGTDVEPDVFEEELQARMDRYNSRSIDVNTHSDSIEERREEIKDMLHSLGYLSE